MIPAPSIDRAIGGIAQLRELIDAMSRLLITDNPRAALPLALKAERALGEIAAEVEDLSRR